MKIATIVALVALLLGSPSSPEASQNAEYSPKTIAATATLIFANVSQRGYKVMVRNTSAVDVYIGRSNVATGSGGFRVSAGDAASFVVATGDSIYGVVAAATADIYYAANVY